MPKQMISPQLLNKIIEFNELYSDLGWCVNGISNVEITENCIQLGKMGKLHEGESILINHYEENLDFYVRIICHPNRNFSRRRELIHLAKKDYQEERFYSSIYILLSQMDGICNDKFKCNIWDSGGKKLKKFDTNSFSGTYNGLKKILGMSSQSVSNTTDAKTTYVQRHGIMHGRILNFNNKETAIKLWNTIITLDQFLYENNI